MTSNAKRNRQRQAAMERRYAKHQAHERMMAAHKERKAAIEAWQVAYEAWHTSSNIGPRPIHPDDVGTGSDMAAFRYDLKKFTVTA
jgi:hypothetical protein